MCFSAQADLLGGIVVGAIGVDVVRHVDRRHDQAMVAALPLLFAAHQLVEAFVWWGLQGHVAASVGRAAMWMYLLFAFVVLPVYVPTAVCVLEPRGRRRAAMIAFIGLGALVSGMLLDAMVRGPVTATLAHYHVRYGVGLHSGTLIVVAYVVATCGSLVFSGYRDIAIFGVVNLVAVALLARLEVDGFASLWCGWAAVTSGAIALHIRLGRAHPSLSHAAT
ncbi:MAG TPA: DUF6629 family protein [Acidimicrobiales bacterium]|nr:DUF6629 family protein [Acidimicrobiales bacterium]